ncbi:MAG: ATP-binding cassette domain-containing protein, partial [Hyphomicrobiales bacterium]|nr:ATP-binding cassette domain-containing protein [Hyphomicrobiales bacterium]
MAPPLLALRDVKLTFGADPLLDGADLAVGPGERIALVGRNGSGKSTLLRVAAGFVAPDSGERFVQPGARVGYLSQAPDLAGHSRVIDYVAAGLDDEYALHLARAALDDVGLDGEIAVDGLSGGEQRRAALARALAAAPDVLLLDEPTNHLDLPAIEWLQTALAGARFGLVVVSHDRRFLADLTDATVWLDRGRTRRLDRGFSAFEAWRDDLMEREERDAHKLDRKIVAEEHWVRYGVTARRKRNQGRMAKLADLRRERRERRAPTGEAKVTAVAARASGDLVIEARGMTKSFGDRTVVRDFSTRVLRGDRVGLVGANGAGKTT